MDYDVKDIKLADQGKLKIEWAEASMPVLRLIKKRFKRETAAQRHSRHGLPACDDGNRQSDEDASSRRGRVRLCASNPLSTQDDVAASLVQHDGIRSLPSRARTTRPTIGTSNRRSRIKPQVTMDDGADVVSHAPFQAQRFAQDVIGGTEETTTGVIRLRSMAENEACSSSRSFPSTTPIPNTCSTTATAPAKARWTASSARRTG